MESAAKELEESSDDGASKVSSLCLAIPNILRKILKHFSNTELPTLSLVNKQWNYEARCVMRDRGSSIASLRAGSARDLLDFMLALRRMQVVPFSGMKIVLNARRPPADPLELSPQEMTFIYTVIFFNRLTLLKYLHIVDQVGSWGFEENNPRFIFVRQVLQDYCGVPEEIEVTCGPDGSCLQEVVESCSYPNLKKFSFNSDYDYRPRNTNLVNAIVSNAANLQELHIGWWYLREENVVNGSSAMFVPREDFDLGRNWVSESIARRIKMKSLNLGTIFYYSAQEYNRIVSSLLQGSRLSLKSLTIHSVRAVPFMCHDICLEKVSELTIYVDCRALGTLECAVSTSLQAFDFARIFPNLDEVSIENRSSSICPDDLREFLRQSQAAVLKKPTTDRSANIKHLSLSDGLYGCSTAKFFAEMFPVIERLSIGIDDEQEIPCGFIWEHWMDLKEIKVQKNAWIRDVPRVANLDSIFCGIFPEEVDELRGKDDEYLRCVHIVPVMPSITCLKNLRKITLAFQWTVLGKPNNDLVSAFQRSQDSTYVFSKVASLTAFAKCPDLIVTLETNWPPMEKALSHMKPYASVVLTR